MKRIINIKTRLSKDLSTVLLNELENQNAFGLKQCLKTYELIEGWEEAEEVVRKVFREYCRGVSFPHTSKTPLDLRLQKLNRLNMLCKKKGHIIISSLSPDIAYSTSDPSPTPKRLLRRPSSSGQLQHSPCPFVQPHPCSGCFLSTIIGYIKRNIRKV